MASKDNKISITRQCKLLSIQRGSIYYRPGISQKDVELMHRIDALYTEDPARGQRRMHLALRKRFGMNVGRSKIRRLMNVMGIAAIYPKRNLSMADKQHKKYPYLLRNVAITRVNQVWSTDITYIKLNGGFVYLTAVIDWYSRFVLSWRLSASMDTQFCTEVLEEALEKHGTPEVFNTDQGSQYTSHEFTGILENRGINISMDGKGRALDNVFVERLWRTVKYEDIYLKDYGTVPACKKGLAEFFDRYNNRREHSSLDGNYPAEVYFGKITQANAA